MVRRRGSRGIMEVSELSVSRGNQVILGLLVLCLTTFLFVFVVIFVFQHPVKYHYDH